MPAFFFSASLANSIPALFIGIACCVYLYYYS